MTARLDGDTPMLRLVALLERVAAKDQLFSLQALVEDTGLPKPTAAPHAAAARRRRPAAARGDGRHYGTGVRLRRLAENLLLNDTRARRAPRGAAPPGRRGRRKLQHHRAVGQRGALPRPRGDAGAAALLPAPGFARAGALLGQRQGLPGADDAGAAPAACWTMRRWRATRRPPSPTSLRWRRELTAGAARRPCAGPRGIPARPGLRGRAGAAGPRQARVQPGVAMQAPVMRLSHDKALQFLPALQRAAERAGRIDAPPRRTDPPRRRR